MERTERAKEIEKALTEAGFEADRINADVTPTFLPEKGTFVGWKIANPGEPTANLRICTEDGCSISIGTVKASAFDGAITEAKFRQVENKTSKVYNKWVMIGTTPVNPHLSGAMADLCDRLIGREFTTKLIPRVTLKFAPKGYDTKALAIAGLIQKDFYRIDLIPL